MRFWPTELQGIRKSFSTVSRGTVLELLSLSLIVIIAVTVRMMPIRWGFYLNEFDPYLQWRMSQYVVDHGFLAWFKWHDTMSWYPYGADMPTWNLYGEAFVVAAITLFLRAIGFAVSDFDVAVVFPVVAGTLTALVAYVLGKDIWGRGVGMFTALFMALNPSSIGRTQLGFLRHEPLGILLMLLIFIFFRRAMNPTSSMRKTLAYGALAGFSLFYLVSFVGGCIFSIGFVSTVRGCSRYHGSIFKEIVHHLLSGDGDLPALHTFPSAKAWIFTVCLIRHGLLFP